MGGLRTDVERLTRLVPDPEGAADNLVPTTQKYVDNFGVTQYAYVLKAGGTGGGVTSLNAETGAITLTSTGGTVTITMPTSGTINLETAGGSGTVTSVGLSAPAEFTVSGSPVTTAGTLTLTKATQSANRVWAGPTTGTAAQPTFRALVAADIPSLPYGTGTVTSVNGASGTGGFTLTGGPITGAGTLTFASPITTKGDLIVGNGANSATRFAVGADSTVLIADSTQATGTRWGVDPQSRMFYGSGRDGAVTFDGTTVVPGWGLSGGVYTQNAGFDKYYTDIAISGAASLNTNALKLWCSGTLTVTTSAPIAITVKGNNGSNATTTGGAAAGSSGVSAAGSLGNSAAGNSGGAGGATTGTVGGAGLQTQKPMMGGGGGQGGKGGTGSSGVGGNGGVSTTSAAAYYQINGLSNDFYGINSTVAYVRVLGGFGGASGGGGGGDGTAGGGGGGGGGGGAIAQCHFRNIDTSGFSGILISAAGGNGGNGFTPTAGNRGGGGAGAGGGGGYVALVYESKVGTIKLDASGGTGGNGANGSGTGTAGLGGAGGAGGFIDVFNTATGAVTIASGTFQGLTAPVVQTGTAGESVTVTL